MFSVDMLVMQGDLEGCRAPGPRAGARQDGRGWVRRGPEN